MWLMYAMLMGLTHDNPKALEHRNVKLRPWWKPGSIAAQMDEWGIATSKIRKRATLANTITAAIVAIFQPGDQSMHPQNIALRRTCPTRDAQAKTQDAFKTANRILPTFSAQPRQLRLVSQIQ